jgi:hypothetical protein
VVVVQEEQEESRRMLGNSLIKRKREVTRTREKVEKEKGSRGRETIKVILMEVHPRKFDIGYWDFVAVFEEVEYALPLIVLLCKEWSRGDGGME